MESGSESMLSIDADGLTGSLMAIESFPDARAILNGPGGCRNYHSFLSELHYPRPMVRDEPTFQEQYFFGQSRIPCTYLDEEDYIRGAIDKVEDLIGVVRDKGDTLSVIINSPGAALIGDDIGGAIVRNGLSGKMLSLEDVLVSTPVSSSYDATVRSIIASLDISPADRVSQTVNLLGMSILNKGWRDDVMELRRILTQMGVKILSTPGAGSTVSKITDSVKASCNIVVSPELGLRTAELYKERYGIPYIIPSDGAPVGFKAVRNWIEQVAKATGSDPIGATLSLSSRRVEACRLLTRFQFHTTLPKGATFAIKADSSMALPLTEFLMNYLGMIPVAVRVNPGEYLPMAERLRSLLEESGFGGAWDRDITHDRADIVLADGHSVRLLKRMGACQGGVDLGLPSLDRFDFIPRPLMGPQGTMHILDEIINSL
ncbi:MAG: nitrogenase component 1 [Methanomassiliicoccus sp.]|nr:nitrogenase component 1 [Methanomassiliicoccus sp.]